MDLRSHNGYLICKSLDSEHQEDVGFGIVANCESGLPKYEVIDTDSDDTGFNGGDVVILNAQPTKVEADGKVLYLTSSKNVIGKVISNVS